MLSRVMNLEESKGPFKESNVRMLMTIVAICLRYSGILQIYVIIVFILQKKRFFLYIYSLKY